MINKVLRFKDGSQGLFLKQGVSAEMMGWTKNADEVTVKRATKAREDRIYNDKNKPIGGKFLTAYKIMIEGGGVEEIMKALDRDRKAANQYMSVVRRSNRSITFPCDVKPQFNPEQLEMIKFMELGLGTNAIAEKLNLTPKKVQFWMRYIRDEKGDEWRQKTLKRKPKSKPL